MYTATTWIHQRTDLFSFSVTDLIKPAGQVYCCNTVDMQSPPVIIITKNVHYCLWICVFFLWHSVSPQGCSMKLNSLSLTDLVAVGVLELTRVPLSVVITSVIVWSAVLDYKNGVFSTVSSISVFRSTWNRLRVNEIFKYSSLNQPDSTNALFVEFELRKNIVEKRP